MPGSHTRLYIHIVFAPKGRLSIHDTEKRDKLLHYLSGIVTNLQSHLISGSVMPDHVHLLVGLHPSLAVSELVQKVKANSSKHINTEKWFPGRFSWCEGYGAFSVSQSMLEKVSKYIANQEEHHKKHKLYDEVMSLLQAHGLKADDPVGFWVDKQG
jgi:REP element-mobilizing transposase RayT